MPVKHIMALSRDLRNGRASLPDTLSADNLDLSCGFFHELANYTGYRKRIAG